MSSYFFALKLYYINCYLSLKAFNIFYIALIIKNGKRFFSKQKVICLLITTDILEKITKNKYIDFNKLNIDTMLKIA